MISEDVTLESEVMAAENNALAFWNNPHFKIQRDIQDRKHLF